MSLILDYWFLTPASVAAATIATMVGIGEPVFFTPLFISVLELPPAKAVAAALFAQSFGFLSGTVAYWRSTSSIALTRATCSCSQFRPASWEPARR